jgi:hypothetical protein
VLALLLAGGLSLLLLTAPQPAAAEETHQRASRAGVSHLFRATLSGAQENPVIVTKASGYAVLALSADMSTLSYRVLTADLISVTAAHIHEGAVGQNGGVLIDLAPGASGPISGTTSVTAEQVAKLLSGNTYVNIHTARHGSGEIRGQVTPATAPAAHLALLTGDQETPPVETDGVGVARFTLVTTDTLEYHIAVSNTDTIQLAHIHKGVIGVAGPPIITLYTGTVPFDAATPLTGVLTIDQQTMVDLLTGYLYVNIHTASHAPGEVRGQIGGAALFNADLDGNQEAPPVDTLAYGRGVAALNAAGTALSYRVIVNDLDDITAAHIHRAPVGVSGPVEFGLPSFGSNRVISGTIAVSDTHVLRLLAGDYYFNIHTSTHGSGEIRGQLERANPVPNYNALLTGGTEAAGFARLRLLGGLNVLNSYVAVTNTTNIQAMHIHKAPPGVDGPVVFDLFTPGFSNAQPASRAVMLDASHLVDLLTGYYYVNVHTAARPSGEIRGQISGAQAFTAVLDGAQETPVRNTSAFGVGVLGLSADLSTLFYRVSIEGITNATAAHIHQGKVGVAGPIDFDLQRGRSFGQGRPVSGTLTLTDVHVLRLVGGSHYINVHTLGFPPGEIRGQVLPYTPMTHWNALLAGANEVPAVTTEAAGVARLSIHPLLSTLHYHVAVTNTANIQAAHIHRGSAGVNGPIAINLYNGEVFDNDTPLIGTVRFGAQTIVDLLTGYYYVNIHTQAVGSGEIRGQVGGARLYQAVLAGANEVPPVTTAASGLAVLALSPDAKQLSYRVTVEDIVNITLAHIHVGKVGQNGPVAFDLMQGNPFSVTRPISGLLAVSTRDLQNLAAGKFYVNVHTQAVGSGEIRGQVERFSPNTNFRSLLTEGAEVAPSAVDAAALASFQLNLVPAAWLQYRLDAVDLTNITLAHIHKGLPGVNGPIVFDLYLGGGTFAVGAPVRGAVLLNETQLVDLLTGYYYVNIHTQDKPAGKVRGQVLVNGAFTQTFMPAIAAP